MDRLSGAGHHERLREFVLVTGRQNQSPSIEGIGNFRLMVIIMFAKRELPRRDDDMATMFKSGDERAGSAMADEDIGFRQRFLHLGERQGFDAILEGLGLDSANTDLRQYPFRDHPPLFCVGMSAAQIVRTRLRASGH